MPIPILVELLATVVPTLISGTLNAESAEQFNKEARKAEAQQRADTQRRQRASEALTRESLAQSERQFQTQLGFQKEQANLLRGERAEERTSQRRAATFNRAIGLLNSDVGMRDRVAQQFGGV